MPATEALSKLLQELKGEAAEASRLLFELRLRTERRADAGQDEWAAALARQLGRAEGQVDHLTDLAEEIELEFDEWDDALGLGGDEANP